MTNQVNISQWIKGSRKRVFEALAGRDSLSKWYCPEGCTPDKAEGDVVVGGRYVFAMNCGGRVMTTEGIYKEVVPGEKLVFTHHWKESNSVETLVTITLKDEKGGTLVTLVQTGFDDEASAKGHSEGWGSALGNLAKGFAQE